MSSELIAIGIVKRPVGLDGYCAIEPFGSTFGSLKPPCAILLGKSAETVERIVIEKIVHRPAGYQCRFEGRLDRTSIEGLRGRVIYIDNETLPALKGNEFYHFELVGMVVSEDKGMTDIGKVIDVHNFPSVDTLEVKPENGESIMIPLSEQAIAGIDRPGRRVTVHLSFVEELLQ